MSKPRFDLKKIVVFTGAGVSAPSGIPTFRSSDGLWCSHRIEDVATPEGFRKNPALVLDFYNQRRAAAAAAQPNPAHLAIAELEKKYQVTVITQNVDNLHERAGSTNVIHLHGELTKARSTRDPSFVIEIGSNPIQIGDLCPEGSQLRPHIVWFGEEIFGYSEALDHVTAADKLLVVGTSLAVYPAAGLVRFAASEAERVLVDLELTSAPAGFALVSGSAEVKVPEIVARWIS